MKKRGEKLFHDKKRNFAFSLTLIIVVFIIVFIDFYSSIQKAYFVLILIAGLGSIWAFYIVDSVFSLGFKKRHYIFVAIISFASLISAPMYYIWIYYDKVQHFIFPMMLGSIVFFLISKLRLSLRWKLVFTFFTIMGTITILEIFEYVFDHFFDLALQGVYLPDPAVPDQLKLVLSKIDDTMIDFILGVFGSLIYLSSLVTFFRRRLNSTPTSRENN